LIAHRATGSLLPFALFYFWTFAYSGLFGPFWGLYLDSLRFSSWQIALLISLSTLARIVAPGFWGWLADRQGRRRPIILLSSLASVLGFALICLHDKTFAWMFVWLALVHFFWSAALPLVEASTAWLTRAQPGRYSQVRVWGSIGYLLMALLGGYLLEHWPLASVPWLVLALLALIALAAYGLPETETPAQAETAGSLAATLRQPAVIVLFGCCFLMAFAFGPYYTFYSIGLKNAGYDKSLIGWLWALGVLCEIAVFWLMPRIMRRMALERLMLLSLVCAVLRFALIALAIDRPLWALSAQLLHAPTFALHHAAAIGLIHRYFALAQQAQGQGLYIIASFGVGGSAGGLLAGALWDQGGVALVFALSALAAALGVGLCCCGLSAKTTVAD
jgi:PPP family 3-phenylpropionic acid transporter